ncbi:MAG: hypothetical protein EOO10_10800 [Chitinophagaceae bacterium]|nr:MAG: hypothetical protein EOO10_10800 [Chitinophagaceae bacterium]
MEYTSLQKETIISSSGKQDTIQTEVMTDRWQRRLLPWIISVPTVLILAFILLSTLQMRRIEDFVYQNSGLSLKKELPSPSALPTDSINGNVAYVKLYSLASMEEISMNRRYNAAGASMMSGIYTRYLGFFTGMILAIVGAVFIISKYREDLSNVSLSLAEQMKFRAVSSSPGIIFGLLGTVLMIVTIVKKTDFEVKDSPLYLNYTTMPADRMNEVNFNPAAVNDIPEHTTPNDSNGIDPGKAKNSSPEN